MGVNFSTDEMMEGDFMFHVVVVLELVSRPLILMSLVQRKWVSQHEGTSAMAHICISLFSSSQNS